MSYKLFVLDHYFISIDHLNMILKKTIPNESGAIF